MGFMNLWVVVPVKLLQKTKSRLGGILSPGERAQLTQVLLERTLGLLQTVPRITETAVISQDPIVATMAATFGCQWTAEPAGSGLNAAVAIGTTLAAQNGATHCLVLPSDLPFLAASELAELIGLAETAVLHPTLILCSDQQQQGTNGMILPTGVGFRFRYGRNSFYHHQQEAARLGLACQVVQLPSLQFDLDTEQDYALYTKKRNPAPAKS
jgi:2-phospho-L-lactate guanylyltransferase